MQTRMVVGAALLAGLCLAGCAVTGDSGSEPSLSTVDQADTVWCSDKSWRVNFYSEPELINVVGTLRCVCFQPQVQTGIYTQNNKLITEITCDLR
jgi:hypothetical protein